MKKYISTILLSLLFVAPVMAEKPEWAGKGKPTEEQKAAHRTAMEAKDDFESEDKVKELKEKKVKKKEMDTSLDKEGLEKQKFKKLDQDQKELEKGSAKGKESKEENSKKWWKFWGE